MADVVRRSIDAIAYALEGNHDKARAVVRNNGLGTDEKWQNGGNWECLSATAALLGADDPEPINRFLDKMRDHGLAELGPLYGPAGDWATATVGGLATQKVEAKERCLEYSRWFARLMTPLTVKRRPDGRIRTMWKGDMLTAKGDPNPRGTGWTMTPGPRGEFGGPGMGWHSESPATLLLQWIADAPHRRLPHRWDTYRPHQYEAWDYPFWALARAAGMPFTRAGPLDIGMSDAERQAMQRHWKDGSLYDELLAHGGNRIRFGLEALRFADGSLLIVSHRNTASPKSPVCVIDWDGPTRDQVIHVPDGHTNKGARGEGRLETGVGGVWGVAYSSRTEVTSRSRVRPVEDVTRHLVWPARSDAGWELGELDPENRVPAPPPLPAPVKLYPFHESEQWGEVELAWRPVEGADGYEVVMGDRRIRMPGDQTSITYSAFVERPVWWNVAAFRTNKDPGPSGKPWMFQAVELPTADPRPDDPPDDGGGDGWKFYLALAVAITAVVLLVRSCGG